MFLISLCFIIVSYPLCQISCYFPSPLTPHFFGRISFFILEVLHALITLAYLFLTLSLLYSIFKQHYIICKCVTASSCSLQWISSLSCGSLFLKVNIEFDSLMTRRNFFLATSYNRSWLPDGMNLSITYPLPVDSLPPQKKRHFS